MAHLHPDRARRILRLIGWRVAGGLAVRRIDDLLLTLLALRLEACRDARAIGKDRIFDLLNLFAAVVAIVDRLLLAAGLGRSDPFDRRDPFDRHDPFDRRNLAIGDGLDGMFKLLLFSGGSISHQSCAPL